MKYKHNPDLTSNAKNLRKGMTKEERHLWYDFLKDYPVRFLRQKVIGNYIVDFLVQAQNLLLSLTVRSIMRKQGYCVIKSEPGVSKNMI